MNSAVGADAVDIVGYLGLEAGNRSISRKTGATSKSDYVAVNWADGRIERRFPKMNETAGSSKARTSSK